MCRLGPICIEICEAAPAPVGPQFPCGSPLGILRVDPGLGVPISIPRSHFQPLWSCGSPYNSPRADPALPLLPFHIFSFDKYVSSFHKIVCSRRDLLCKEWLRSYSCHFSVPITLCGPAEHPLSTHHPPVSLCHGPYASQALDVCTAACKGTVSVRECPPIQLPVHIGSFSMKCTSGHWALSTVSWVSVFEPECP